MLPSYIMSNIIEIIFSINMDVRVNLRVFRLISRILKLTTI